MKHPSLARRFMIGFFLISLLPLWVFGYISIRQNEIELRNETLARMSRLADKKILQIKTYLSERIHDAELISRNDRTYTALNELSRVFAQRKANAAAYNDISRAFNDFFSAYIGRGDEALFYDVFLVMPGGDIVYTYKQEPDFLTNLLTGPYKDSQLAIAFRESILYLESNISEFEFYKPSQEAAAFIATPIFHNGKLAGVLAFQLDSKQVYHVAMDNTGLGSTGETVFGKRLNPGEALFVSPLRHDPGAALKRTSNLSELNLPLNNALRGERGSGVGIDYSGREVVAAWRYLADLNWGMVVKMDIAEAFEPIYRQRKVLLESLIVVLTICGFFAFYFARELIMRIKNIVAVADEISAGNLEKRVEVTKLDEIGILGKTFNRMTESLQTLYRTLEDRIEKRTNELTQANEELQRNQDLLNEAQRLGHLGSWELDLVKSELRWSDEIYHIFELDQGTFSPSYEKFLEVIHPADREKVNKAYLQSLEDQKPYVIEHRLKMSDGRIKWVREQCTSNFDKSGKAIRSVGAVQDITEQKITEDRLRIAAVAFETHEAILITDVKANIIRVNQAFTDITGFTPEDVLNKNPRILSSGRHDKAFYTAMWKQLISTGSWTGEIWDRRKSGQIYPKWLTITAVKNDHGETTEYVGIFSDITARKQAEEEIRNLAFYDALTKLPNRRLLLDRFRLSLTVSHRNNKYSAVLFLDMDKFKTLNDTLGHFYGDLLLVEVSQRIKSCVREEDTVSRLGGDEFVVLIEEVDANADDAAQKVALIAEKIRDKLASPYKLMEHEYHSSPSIGVCLYRGISESVDEILKHADMAMYQAKDAGRNTIRFFDPIMQQTVESRAAFEYDLRQALPGRQFALYYQVQVDNERRPVGAEALLRWIHPQRGFVPPSQFIPIAEESSLILEIGQWVIETACRQLAAWSQNEKTRNLSMAVNVSFKQFRLSGFVDKIAEIIEEYHINPSLLKIELTESVIMSDIANVLGKMNELKKLKLKLSMDDFGTGYSSLAYLKQLPLDQLKIDQSFVRDIVSDPNDAVMVQTIINMAQNFKLDIIAEGVETPEQLAFLKRHGCYAYQGYLFGKPVPIEDFEKSL